MFNLFGLYGNVVRIKIMFKNRRNALVQFQNCEQANKCKQYLNNIPFCGQELKVNESNVQEIQQAGSVETESILTSDFSNSPAHRFKMNGSRNLQNMTKPSNVLHFSNLPAGTNIEVLTQTIFQRVQPTAITEISSYRFIGQEEGPTVMVLVQLESIKQTVSVISQFHNLRMKDKDVKISFSKNQIDSKKNQS